MITGGRAVDPGLDNPLYGLLALPPSRLPYQANVLIRSFILERPAGRVILYNSPGLTAAAEQIRNLGGADHLLVDHWHEAMCGNPDLDVPVFVHQRERAETATSMQVAGAFDRRDKIAPDLEVIPTPGHTSGTTSYLWDSGGHRFLFTGDFIWVEDGEWKVVLLGSSDRPEYLDSLRLVRELDFDVLVPWRVTDTDPAVAVANGAEIREHLDAIISRLEAGSDR